MPGTTKGWLALAVAAAVALPSALPPASAQAYPAKPVRVLIPYPPGGSNDIVGRVVAQRLSDALGQPFVVENRAGATGTIGAEVAAKSPPDGYLIMVHSASHVANAHIYKNLPYDTLRDFTGVMPLAVQVGMLVVHPSLPVKTVKEFIALARARPGQVVYASTGSGGYPHLTMTLLNYMTGTRMVHVPYKGSGPAVIALAAGETQTMIVAIGALIPMIKAQRLRPLAVASEGRVKQFPDVPTLAEAGVAGYELTAWVGAFVPSATPGAIVERLNAELRKALEHPEVAKMLGAQTLDPMPMTPQQFARRLQQDYDKYEKLIKLTGAKAE